MGAKIVISLILFLSISNSYGQVKTKPMWILYNSYDSLSHKIDDGKVWYFSKSQFDNEPLHFCLDENCNYQDTIPIIPENITLTTRKELISIWKEHIENRSKVSGNDQNPFKDYFKNLNWFNQMYNPIFIIEPLNEVYLIYRVKYKYIIL